MSITTFSGRAFNQDSGAAKKAAKAGPVFITDRGRPAHVLLTIEDYEKLTGQATSLAQAVAQTTDFDFEPARLNSLGLRVPVLG